MITLRVTDEKRTGTITVDPATVQWVYSGKNGCACGCKGRYSYSETAKREDWQGKVSAVAIKRFMNLAAGRGVWEIVSPTQWAFVTDAPRDDQRLYMFEVAEPVEIKWEVPA